MLELVSALLRHMNAARLASGDVSTLENYDLKAALDEAAKIHDQAVQEHEQSVQELRQQLELYRRYVFGPRRE